MKDNSQKSCNQRDFTWRCSQKKHATKTSFYYQKQRWLLMSLRHHKSVICTELLIEEVDFLCDEAIYLFTLFQRIKCFLFQVYIYIYKCDAQITVHTQ